MGLDDTFSFDEAAYAARVKNMSLQELRTREVVKYRQKYGAKASVCGGVGLAPITVGVSLLASAYGGRRHYIASKKLQMVQAELESRSIAKYEPRKRDVLIPLAVTAGTMGLGVGLDAMAVHVTSTAAAQLAADHGSVAVQQVIGSPETVVHSLGQGVSAQVHEVGQLLTGGLQHATDVANLDSSYIMAGATLVDPAAAVGFAAGAVAAQLVETKLAMYVSGKIALRLVNSATGNKTQPITFAKPRESCGRMKTPPQYLLCSHCKGSIETNTAAYYHCCSCLSGSKDEAAEYYDACENCINVSDKGCSARETHVLFKIAPANKPVSCSRFGKEWLSMTVTLLFCKHCLKPISETDYYHCCDCLNDAFDMCKPCYDSGKRCLSYSHNTLRLLPEPRKSFWEETKV